MAGKKYIAILTPAGEAKMAAAAISGEPVGFSHMGVGDGGGTPYQPYAEQTGWLMSFIVPRLTAWSLPTVVQT